MKNRSLFALSFSAGLIALTLTGCSSFSNNSKGPDATKPVGGKAINLIQFRDDVKATHVALDRTTEALGRIPGATSPTDAYAAFSTEFAAFKKIADKTLIESGNVRNRGNDLFAQWQLEAQSINNADIRAVAEKRHASLQTAYNAMLQPLVTARGDLNTVTSDLTDIQKALALDLTPAGISAIKKPLSKVKDTAATSGKSLDALAADLDKIVTQLPASTIAPVK